MHDKMRTKGGKLKDPRPSTEERKQQREQRLVEREYNRLLAVKEQNVKRNPILRALHTRLLTELSARRYARVVTHDYAEGKLEGELVVRSEITLELMRLDTETMKLLTNIDDSSQDISVVVNRHSGQKRGGFVVSFYLDEEEDDIIYDDEF